MALFVQKEKEEWWFVTTLSSTTSPTAVQINAGTRITDDIRSVSGFTAETTFVDVPTMKGGRAPKLAGGQVNADSTLTMAEHSTYATNTVKQALVEGATGYIVINRYGPKGNVAAAAKVDVFPVTIGGNNRTHTVDDAPAEYTVSFGITADVEIDSTVA